MPDAAAPAHSQVVVFPPVIPISGFILGVVLERILPLAPRIAPSLLTSLRGIGLAVLVIGAAGFAWMVRTMKQARAPIHNAKTPTALVESGPFSRTRNPMYLFGTIAYAGLALVLVQPWSLALLPAVFLATHYGVVLKEEEFLEEHFGEAYRQYKARVARWF